MKGHICRLCESGSYKVIYKGLIRSGGVGSGFVEGYEICQCQECGLVSLSPLPDNLAEFYESEQYRMQFFEEIDVANMQKRYDIEQNERVKRIGIYYLRNHNIKYIETVEGSMQPAIRLE